MTLTELIEFLEKQDTELVLANGFGNPHSYRGYYEQLAFDPMNNVTVGDMLACAKSSLGKSFCGWKGGNFVMGPFTEVWMAYDGECGEPISKSLLSLMIENEELKRQLAVFRRV